MQTVKRKLRQVRRNRLSRKTALGRPRPAVSASPNARKKKPDRRIRLRLEVPLG
jgi:hypothetical protein